MTSRAGPGLDEDNVTDVERGGADKRSASKALADSRRTRKQGISPVNVVP